MKRYHCPKCKQASFSYWQKHSLGPMRKIRCANCGASVSVPWGRSVFVLFVAQVFSNPGFVIVLIVVPASWSFQGTAVIAALGYLVGLIPFLVAWSRFVPLVQKRA